MNWKTIETDGMPPGGHGKCYLLKLCDDGRIDGRTYTVARAGRDRFYDEATGKSISRVRVEGYIRINKITD